MDQGSVIAKTTLRVPPLAQIGVAAVLAALAGSGVLHVDNLAWSSMATYYVFFLVGMHARTHVEQLAQTSTVWRTAVFGLFTVAAAAGVYATGGRAVPGAWLLLSCVAVTFGICLATLLGRTPAGPPLSNLGRNTLPIYLIHVPVVAALVAATDAALAPTGLVGVLLTLIVAAIAIVTSLALQAPLRRLAPWLISLPVRRREPVHKLVTDS